MTDKILFVELIMDMTAVYLEIQQSINSGAIASLPKERLAQFSAALARPQAYTHFSAPEFPQVCETVRTLLIVRSNEEALGKIPNPAASPPTEPTNSKTDWHEKPLGKVWLIVVGGVLLALTVYALRNYIGIP